MTSQAIGAKSSTKVKVNRHPMNDMDSYWGIVKHALPTNSYKMKNFKNLARPLLQIGVARAMRSPIHYGMLFAKNRKVDGTVEDYGLVSLRLVTTVGVRAVVDAMAGGNTPAIDSFTFHALGTGTVAAAAGDDDLGTGVEDRVDSTDAAGSTESGNGRYSTSAEVTAGADRAVTEHGLFSALTGGTMFDRSVFSVINLSNGDSLTTTYRVDFNSGS